MTKRTPRKLICVVLALVLTLSLLPMSAFAAGEVAINETNFPDPVFRQYVLDNCDTDKNKALSNEEIQAVTKIDCASCEIKKLKGIEHFSALTSLDCVSNLLMELDLSRNSELTYLNCSSNFLSTLDLSNNRKLEEVLCIGNELSNINVRNCTALRYLLCWDNIIPSLDLSQNTALTSVQCGGNPLTSLDVSHNPALEEIGIKRCKVTALDLSNNPALKNLDVDDNQLTKLDLSNNPSLTNLHCYNNLISSLDLGSNTALTHLSCSKNMLTSLDLSQNSSLTYLDSSENSYTINKQTDFDYTTLPGKFDVTKVSNVKGGKFDTANHTFTFDDGVTEATYDYATGNSNVPSASFKLVYSGSDVPVTPSKNPFTDVPADQYYYEPVQWAVKNGITSGVSKDKFGPNNPCTRGQIVTFLWAAAGRPEPTSTTNPFRDVSTKDYFYKAVLWAVENKITAGASPDRFAPHQTCTRAQTVTFLWAFLGKPSSYDDLFFSDVSANDYFAVAVDWAFKNGVTTGVGGGRFGPHNTCTRGQIVTFLYNLPL